ANGFSYWAWVYLYSIDQWARFIDLGGSGPSSDNIVFAIQNDGSLNFQIYRGSAGGPLVHSPPDTVVPNQWIHVAVTQDAGGNVTIYVNGAVVKTGTTSVPKNVDRTTNYIGRSNWASGDSYLNAILAEVSVWDVVKPPTPVGTG